MESGFGLFDCPGTVHAPRGIATGRYGGNSAGFGRGQRGHAIGLSAGGGMARGGGHDRRHSLAATLCARCSGGALETCLQ